MMHNAKRLFSIILIWLFLTSAVLAQEPTRQNRNKALAPAAGSNPVVGSGTTGQIPKWLGVDGSNTFTIGNSNIFEDKLGKVGIGTLMPTSLLTVRGMIETTLGGYKFPDGSIQTIAFDPGKVVRSLNTLTGDVTLAGGENITIAKAGNTLTVAAPNVLTTVAHDNTLVGDGTLASPLGITSPLEIRDLDNPARQPFQATRTCTAVAQVAGCSFNLAVPAGKRLVLEYVSLLARLPAGQVVAFDIETTVNDAPVVHRLPFSPPAIDMFNTGSQTSIGQQVRLYADPGTTFSINANRAPSAGGATFIFSISGYLVNIP
jgi:hypothetical protein